MTANASSSAAVLLSFLRISGHLLPFVLTLLSVWSLVHDYRQGTSVRAFPLLVSVLCVFAIAYRYYSAFLAARVAVLNDSRQTPAHQFRDGQNYHPTNRWVLFGHHFAAISGAGPLIGPVLAMQWGYAPGLLWLVAGVCLAGAVQDMLVLAASVRRGGKSLAQIALVEMGRPAAIVTSLAILFIVVIALAGLGIVVVKALGGEDLPLPQGATLVLPEGAALHPIGPSQYDVPPGTKLSFPGENPETAAAWGDRFAIALQAASPLEVNGQRVNLPPKTILMVPGSSWGLFTIACTVPIALFVGLYMYRIRKGAVVEASLIGAVLVLGATIAGSWIPNSPLREWFSLSKGWTTFALASYGFIASVSAGLSVEFPENRYDRASDRWFVRRQPGYQSSAVGARVSRHRSDLRGQHLSVRIHLCDVRRHLRIPFTRLLRDDAEDGGQGIGHPTDRLRSHAHGGDRRCRRVVGGGFPSSHETLLPH
jgi:hypothetical protein